MPLDKNSDRAFLQGLDDLWVKMPALKVTPASNERLIRICAEHWIKYVFPTFLYFILTATAVFFLYLAAFSGRYGSTIAVPMFLASFTSFWIVHHWFLWFLLAESETHIIVTSKRVLYIKSGLLWGEETIEIAYEKMKTVEAHKTTLLQSMLNYGTLQFEPFKIHRIPHPGTLARLIQQSMGML